MAVSFFSVYVPLMILQRFRSRNTIGDLSYGVLVSVQSDMLSLIAFRVFDTHMLIYLPIPDIMIAIYCSIATYYADLQLTIRSRVYSLFGDWLWRWIGDAFHGFSAAFTVAGVCSSMSLGVIQITAGLQRLDWIDPTNTELNRVYAVVMWSTSALATVFVFNGLKRGIKFLVVFGCCTGCLVIILAFFIEKQISEGNGHAEYFLKSLFFLLDIAKYFLLSLLFVK